MGATKEGKKELIAMTDGHRESAESWRELLLAYLRKAKSVEELIPYLYLKGVSSGDFTDALREASRPLG
ncbi:Transposase, Mutator family [Botrimarina colliarenosi]|nr:Transposase, Mutator family [Botrimarina colliarenosi]